MELVGKIRVKCVLTVRTGLHIGGQKETYTIGGLDNPVIRTKMCWRNGEVKELPYIPGSSLKGKLRSLIEEKRLGGVFCSDPTSPICKMFGPGPLAKKENGNMNFEKSRLQVRDAFLSQDQTKELESVEFVEIKTENTINRKSGKAENLREIERVLPDTKFDVEFIISLYKDDDPQTFLQYLLEGLMMMEDDYLGGCGSRGYGKVSFSNITVDYKSKDAYETGSSYKEIKRGSLIDIMKDLASICSTFKK